MKTLLEQNWTIHAELEGDSSVRVDFTWTEAGVLISIKKGETIIELLGNQANELKQILNDTKFIFRQV